MNFNPRAPCGARLWTSSGRGRPGHFNPRAPCGARPALNLYFNLQKDFNPRAPCGARRRSWWRRRITMDFNPRAPCGARRRAVIASVQSRYFNPRAPCGARQDEMREGFVPAEFQSTRPVRGATKEFDALAALVGISIHAPRAGRDAWRWTWRRSHRNFNPRAPCGARLSYLFSGGTSLIISIHAPRAGRDICHICQS